jgi:membrane protease YdiL (CAAX protease family)
MIPSLFLLLTLVIGTPAGDDSPISPPAPEGDSAIPVEETDNSSEPTEESPSEEPHKADEIKPEAEQVPTAPAFQLPYQPVVVNNTLYLAPVKIGCKVVLNTLISGLGHFSLQDYKTGGALLASGIGAFGISMFFYGRVIRDIVSEQWDSFEASETSMLGFTNPDISLMMKTLLMWQNIKFYSAFAAFRDARKFNEEHFGISYRYPVRDYDLKDFLRAPYNPKIALDWKIWVPILAFAGISLLIDGIPGDVGETNIFTGRNVDLMGVSARPGWAALFETMSIMSMNHFVSVGEESLFRGVIQHRFAERWGKYRGIPLASVLFGLPHMFNVPSFEEETREEKIEKWKNRLLYFGFTTLAGAYMGFLYEYYDFDLRKSIAFHFWYNVTISLVSFIINPHADNYFSFSHSIPFGKP